METISTYMLLFAICGVVILSYFFTILNRLTRIPSVLLLMGTGIALSALGNRFGFSFPVPVWLIELLGTVGLIMIVLEAGLDLQVSRDKLPLIKRSFASAVSIFVLSSVLVTALLVWWLPADTPLLHCLVYAIPLSIVSSAIVLPSVRHLNEAQKEFLIYEASFSDVVGIMVFNFFTTNEAGLRAHDVVWFGTSIVVALTLSVGVCFGLMWLLVRNRINIRFFLSFAVLIAIYVGGKMLHLPSLLTILLFGLIVNNWQLIQWPSLKRYFSDDEVDKEALFLKAITAESSFLIRTFFFLLFGYSLDISQLADMEVWKIGGFIVLALFLMRFIYLRLMHQYKDIMPHVFYFPRGLITVLLFYKIPTWQKIQHFDEGILSFIILATSFIMMVAALLYRDRPVTVHAFEEAAAAEPKP